MDIDLGQVEKSFYYFYASEYFDAKLMRKWFKSTLYRFIELGLKLKQTNVIL